MPSLHHPHNPLLYQPQEQQVKVCDDDGDVDVSLVWGPLLSSKLLDAVQPVVSLVSLVIGVWLDILTLHINR
jgi:hypothetical protein